MTTVANERRLLKIGDVAARLNCSTATVRRLVDRGLPVLRLGHVNCSLRVDAAELEAWLYSNGDGYPIRVEDLARPQRLAERRLVAGRPLAGQPEEAA